MNEYANAYMHPNRSTISQQQQYPPHHRLSTAINTNAPPTMMTPIMNPNNFYYQNNSTHHQIANHQSAISQNSFSNLIEVSQYANSPNVVDCMRRQTQVKGNVYDIGIQKHAKGNVYDVAMQKQMKGNVYDIGAQKQQKGNVLDSGLQKGNVLIEIVPNADIQHNSANRGSELANEQTKCEKVLSIEKQHQQALQRQKQERIKRKIERDNRRIARYKRREYLMDELNRLSHQLIVGEDGKMIRAGELLKSAVFDGKSINITASEIDESDEQVKEYVEPTSYSYDPEANIGKSILSERNGNEPCSSTPKYVNFNKNYLFRSIF